MGNAQIEKVMPNVKEHDTVAMITSGISIPLLYFGTQAINTIPDLPLHDCVFFAAMFLLTNAYMSPDMDLKSTPYHRWGLLKWYWWPYVRLIKHRSILSHSGPLSFTLRCLYLFLPFIILFIVYPQVIAPQVIYYFILFWIAGACSDTLHVIMDSR